ncbi:hypothetical protein FCULG_00000447 [Fusarium culmorum]|uniref:Inner centromere protein ARK-binding domain-containing protein n=1 Tax=Fusarium culmorum TaxID=5516 RepID=A0A2T4GMM0_FUSCU|nr:hypothetical protein FCULG_00000447 [Fusarium culmorum]
MAALRGPRIPTGSAAWVADERASALTIVDVEVDEFTYAAQNEFEWLNEHMASIFNENETNIAETFKTPGKLRGKTPRTARKLISTETRMPLSNVFGGTPTSSANRFAQHLYAQSPQRELLNQAKSSSPRRPAPSPKPAQSISNDAIDDASAHPTSEAERILSDQDALMTVDEETEALSGAKSQPPMQADSGYFGSQDVNPVTPFDPMAEDEDDDEDDSLLDGTSFDEDIAFPQPSSSRVSPVKQGAKSSSPAKSQEPATDDIDMGDVDEEPEANEDAIQDDAQSQSDGPSPVRPGFRNSLQFASLPAREPLTAGKARVSRTSHIDPKRTSYLARGKSMASHAGEDASDESDQDDMEVDELPSVPQSKNAEELALHHNKTYTQMLQDKISVLGKSQPSGSRPSKSIHSITHSQQPQTVSQSVPEPQSTPPRSPKKQDMATTPGAFPQDDEDDDDWIVPPTTQKSAAAPPTRPSLSKSRTADVMEGIHGKQTLGSFDLDEDAASIRSPARAHSQRERPSYMRHSKSVSVPAVPIFTASERQEGSPLKQTVFGSDSPRDRLLLSQSFQLPLKHLKNKMSSILSTSKGLMASSAALSAEGKSSLLSPSRVQVGTFPVDSDESVAHKPSIESFKSGSTATDQQSNAPRPVAKRTRASVEREKEEKRREKEARFQAEQMDKLEKEREKEREKARVFSKEQEKLANLEKQVVARKEAEQPVQATPQPKRTSPRRAKPQEELDSRFTEPEMEMVDAPSLVPPPSVSRSAAPSQLSRAKEIRRIGKPSRETTTKSKPAPTVHIKVNTGSQLHPGSSVANGYQDFGASTNSQPPQMPSKASKASMQPKSSASGFATSTGSNGRPRALDMVAQKKAQDEQAQRRRDAKAKAERDAKAKSERERAALKEEKKKQELLRRQDEERQKRQALIEKAKKTPAPPPAVRSQPNGPLILSNVMSAIKRPLGRDVNEDGPSRPPPTRGPQYQAKDAKRRRTSDDFADELDMEQPPNIKGPPVRPSSAFKRDLQVKSLASGYTQASAQNLFKTNIAQSHMKGGNPMDMAQIHKGTIPFAPNPNPAGPAYKTPGRPGPVGGLKSAVKSAQRSSPRFQNGDAIDLPEIQTDDEDEEDDEPQPGTVASWANSPAIRAALLAQEKMNPAAIFGEPGPINMDEVFHASKERLHKFRARTSSANWSGNDRLTEEDIRKDLAARDRLRREGGWSYQLGRDMM